MHTATENKTGSIAYLRVRHGDRITTLRLTSDSTDPRARYHQPVLLDPDGELLDGATFGEFEAAEIIADDPANVCRSLGIAVGDSRVVAAEDLDEEALALVGLHPWGTLEGIAHHDAHADSRI